MRERLQKIAGAAGALQDLLKLHRAIEPAKLLLDIVGRRSIHCAFVGIQGHRGLSEARRSSQLGALHAEVQAVYQRIVAHHIWRWSKPNPLLLYENMGR